MLCSMPLRVHDSVATDVQVTGLEGRTEGIV